MCALLRPEEAARLASSWQILFCTQSALGGALEAEFCLSLPDQSCGPAGAWENSAGGAWALWRRATPALSSSLMFSEPDVLIHKVQ